MTLFFGEYLPRRSRFTPKKYQTVGLYLTLYNELSNVIYCFYVVVHLVEMNRACFFVVFVVF